MAMFAQTFLVDGNTPLHLQVDTDQAALLQDVASWRTTRFQWTGLGLAVLMLIGLLGCAHFPFASHAAVKPLLFVPELATKVNNLGSNFIAPLPVLHAESGDARLTNLRPARQFVLPSSRQRYPSKVGVNNVNLYRQISRSMRRGGTSVITKAGVTTEKTAITDQSSLVRVLQEMGFEVLQASEMTPKQVEVLMTWPGNDGEPWVADVIAKQERAGTASDFQKLLAAKERGLAFIKAARATEKLAISERRRVELKAASPDDEDEIKSITEIDNWATRQLLGNSSEKALSFLKATRDKEKQVLKDSQNTEQERKIKIGDENWDADMIWNADPSWSADPTWKPGLPTIRNSQSADLEQKIDKVLIGDLEAAAAEMGRMGITGDTSVPSHLKVDEDTPLLRFVHVDEPKCIGCSLCATAAPNTFFLEEQAGRARVFSQGTDRADKVKEAVDHCPVDCIGFVGLEDLVILESERDGLYDYMPAQSISPKYIGTPPDSDAYKNREHRRPPSRAVGKRVRQIPMDGEDIAFKYDQKLGKFIVWTDVDGWAQSVPFQAWIDRLNEEFKINVVADGDDSYTSAYDASLRAAEKKDALLNVRSQDEIGDNVFKALWADDVYSVPAPDASVDDSGSASTEELDSVPRSADSAYWTTNGSPQEDRRKIGHPSFGLEFGQPSE